MLEDTHLPCHIHHLGDQEPHEMRHPRQVHIHIRRPSLISRRMPVRFRNHTLSEVVKICPDRRVRDKLDSREDLVEALNRERCGPRHMCTLLLSILQAES